MWRCFGGFGKYSCQSWCVHGEHVGESRERSMDFPFMIKNDTPLPFLCHYACHMESSCSVILPVPLD